MQSAYPPGMTRGFTEALAPWGALLDGMNMRFVNGFFYMQPAPFDAPGPEGPKSHDEIGAEIGRRTELAAAAFEQRIWRDVLRGWDETIKPAAIARHRQLADVDLCAIGDDELRDQLHQRISWLTEMAYQHHRFNAMAMLPIGDFILHAVGWTGLAPVPMFAVYDGWSPVSGVVPPELAPVVDAVSDDADARRSARERRPCRAASRRTVPPRPGARGIPRWVGAPASGGLRSHQPDDRRAA